MKKLLLLFLVFSCTELTAQLAANYSGTVTVSGKVRYDNGQPFNNAFIFFANIDNSKFFSGRTDNNGIYSVLIDTGAYYIAAYVSYIQGNMLTNRHLYYNNKQSFTDADKIIFSRNTTDINFTFPVLQLCSISGTIRDAGTQMPLRGVFIAVTSLENNDSTFIGTDQNGDYTINVFEGNYTLYAYQPGYLLEYYKDVNNSFDATPVSVTKNNPNVTGVDFSLTKLITGSNSISGLVGDPMWLSGVEVYAIPVTGGEWIGTRSGNDGRFFIGNLKNGKYVLLFYKEGYKSKYYGDSLNAINLTGNVKLSGIYVIMEKLNSIGGEISGTITSNSNSPLSGTLILAIDSSGDTVSTSISRYDGNYSIPSLTNGSYTIQANKIGYDKKTYPQKVVINLSSIPAVSEINISIIPTAIEGTSNNISESFVLLQNYPNPFNPSTVIVYTIPRDLAYSNVRLTVYDIQGRIVKTLLDKELPAGKYMTKWDGKDNFGRQAASGVYLYSLSVGEKQFIGKMNLIR